ncbi:MAG: SDR family oxidoreductase [Myxococcota bacterium]
MKTVVIGSNRGIGLEIVRQLSARGEVVIAVCRSSSQELRGIEQVEVREGIDITDSASLRALADSLGEGALDSLWVVAGVLRRVTLSPLDLEEIRKQFEINALGPLNAVATLRSTLKRPSKVALLTSRMGSIADNTSGGSYGYRMSKAALNMAGRSLAHDLDTDRIALALLHPGYVKTDMTGGNGNLSPEESAKGLITQMDALTQERSGVFLHQNGDELPW